MPVLPAVPSTTRPPGLISPRFSASRIIWRAGRSFTEPPGFMNSALPRMVQPVAAEAPFELDQRRVADGFDDAVADLHGVSAFSEAGNVVDGPSGDKAARRGQNHAPARCRGSSHRAWRRVSRNASSPTRAGYSINLGWLETGSKP